MRSSSDSGVQARQEPEEMEALYGRVPAPVRAEVLTVGDLSILAFALV